MLLKEFAEKFTMMCNSYSADQCRNECEVYRNLEKPYDDMCEVWVMKHPEKAEEIIGRWANEHV